MITRETNCDLSSQLTDRTTGHARNVGLVRESHYYPPQRSCEVYVFTPVCQSFCSQEGEYLGRYPRAGTPRQVHPPPREQVYPPGRYPLGRYTPPAGTPPGRYTPLGRDTPQAGTPPPPPHPRQTATVADGTQLMFH